jgi:hypothetical protein
MHASFRGLKAWHDTDGGRAIVLFRDVAHRLAKLYRGGESSPLPVDLRDTGTVDYETMPSSGWSAVGAITQRPHPYLPEADWLRMVTMRLQLDRRMR